VGLAFALLAGCPTVDLGTRPPEIGLQPAGVLQYSRIRVWPNYVIAPTRPLVAKVGSCHVAGGNGLDFPAMVDYPNS